MDSDRALDERTAHPAIRWPSGGGAMGGSTPESGNPCGDVVSGDKPCMGTRGLGGRLSNRDDSQPFARARVPFGNAKTTFG